MSVNQLLLECQDNGVSVLLDGSDLRVAGHRDAVRLLIERLKQNKPALVRYLRNERDEKARQENIRRLLYRYQLDGLMFFSVGGVLIIKGSDELVIQARQEMAGKEPEVIRYLETTASCYWILSTMDKGTLPYRFENEMTLFGILEKVPSAISAMPCGYEPGLFDDIFTGVLA